MPVTVGCDHGLPPILDSLERTEYLAVDPGLFRGQSSQQIKLPICWPLYALG